MSAHLEEMGFSKEQSDAALLKTGNDVDLALESLISEKKYSPSPHDVLAEATMPYGAKKKPAPLPNDPLKGDFRRDLTEDADPGALVDNRIAEFSAMGFAVPDIERAFKASQNNVDDALNLLLNQNTGTYFSDSPHDVLVETSDPYKTTQKKKPLSQQHAEDDTKATNFTKDLPDNASLDAVAPATVVDARFSTFLAMGFHPDDAEIALRDANGDINLALTSLLEKSSSS